MPDEEIAKSASEPEESELLRVRRSKLQKLLDAGFLVRRQLTS